MFPYHHGRNLFNQTIANTMAIWRGEELPEQNEKDKLYGHCIIFLETMTESLMQLCLSTLVLREFGLSPNHSQASNQISGLFSSLISIILVFAKVRTKYNEIVIVFILLGFSLSIGNWMYEYLKKYHYKSLGRHDFYHEEELTLHKCMKSLSIFLIFRGSPSSKKTWFQSFLLLPFGNMCSSAVFLCWLYLWPFMQLLSLLILLVYWYGLLGLCWTQ